MVIAPLLNIAGNLLQSLLHHNSSSTPATNTAATSAGRDSENRFAVVLEKLQQTSATAHNLR